MPDSTTDPDFPIWPSGIARLQDSVLEITAGDGIRVAVDDIVEIGVNRAGLDKARTSYWLEPEYEAALQRLVDAVTTTRGAA
jgi:hypothetical protein